MNQSQFRYLGLLDKFLVIGLVAVFGPVALVTSPIAFMGIAGVFAILAGTVSTLSLGLITLSWRHFVGLSYVTFALMWPALFAPEVAAGITSEQDHLLFVVTTVGALCLAAIGIDIARGGRHFSVESNVERTIEL